MGKPGEDREPQGEGSKFPRARRLTAGRKELRDRHRRFSAIFETAPEVVFIFEAEGENLGQIVAANRRAEELHGYALEELLAMKITDLDAPADIFPPPEIIAPVLQGNTVTAEVMHRRKDGSLFPSEVRATLYQVEGQKFVVAFERDISERRQMEEALRIKDFAVASSINAMAFADLDGNLSYTNDSFLKLWGYDSQEEVLNRTVTEFWQPSDKAEEVVAALNASGSWVGELTAVRKDGTPFDVQLSANMITDMAGRPVSVMASFIDITDRKQAQEALQLHDLRLQILLELHRFMDASREQLLDFVLEASLKTVQSQYAFIGLMDAAEEVMTIYSWSQEAMAQCAVADRLISNKISEGGLWGECVRQRKAVIINDYHAPHACKRGIPKGHVPIQRFLGVPVFDNQRIVAVAAVANKQDPYNESDVFAFLALLDRMWGILRRKQAEIDLYNANERMQAQIFEIERLQRQMREQAIRDSLTDLFNRRYLEETLERELARAKREGYPISLVMIDIDRFKAVNDSFGHKAGDQMLKALAALLNAKTRKGDIACRYGGDEFVVLMPQASCQAAALRAEEWRAAFEALRVPFDDKELNATMSLGIVSFTQNVENIDEVLNGVDEALYQSKEAGRNQITVSKKFCTSAQ